MNDKIIYIHRDKNVIADVFQWQEGKELELIKFGVECKFKDGEPILMYIGQDRTYNLNPGDYILKMQGNVAFNDIAHFDYFVLPEAEFNQHVKKYSLKLIENDDISSELTFIKCKVCHKHLNHSTLTERNNELCFTCERKKILNQVNEPVSDFYVEVYANKIKRFQDAIDEKVNASMVELIKTSEDLKEDVQ